MHKISLKQPKFIGCKEYESSIPASVGKAQLISY